MATTVGLRDCWRMPTELGNPHGAVQLSTAIFSAHCCRTSVTNFGWARSKLLPCSPPAEKPAEVYSGLVSSKARTFLGVFQTADAFKAILQGVHLQPIPIYLTQHMLYKLLFSSQVQLRENTRSVLLEKASNIRRKKDRQPPPQIHTNIATRARHLSLDISKSM